MLNITAETTDEEIFAPVNRARIALAEAAETHDPQALVKLAQDVYNAESLALVQQEYRDRFNKAGFLFDVLASGASDTWSGRENDSQRASFDVIRTWAKYQMNNL